MLVQDVTLPISPIYANAGLVCSARALSALLIPDPTLRNQEGAASESLQLSFHRPWPPGEESQGAGGHTLPSMDMGSKMPNCLRTAMNSSTTTAMAHSSIPWMPMASVAETGEHP